MKRILLTSLEFGKSYGVDRAICDLIIAGRLSAVGCSVTGPMWTKEFYQLRDVVEWAEHSTQVGLTVSLTKNAMPVTDFGRQKFGEEFPTENFYRARAPLNLLPIDLLSAEIAVQIDMFENVYSRAPAFIAMQDNLARFPAIADIMIQVVKLMKGREPVLVAPKASGRVVHRFMQKAEKQGLETIRSGPSLPLPLRDDEELRDFFWNSLNNADDQTMVFCSPSYPEEISPTKRERKWSNYRQNQLNFLRGEEFPFLLMEKDIFLF
ncbi:ChbG/HpnK family deacetylase [Flexibacterium corallicola]|uniref:ChbG/HpnK family deacetylase n=1 Tax=Flexibacterium corallicola TaxID=3037259 RepID=UPI00286EE5A3|nr:ChbG/HpnK family deacetylase [Pseudovibrio sp. M1P-2-3]